MPSCPADRLDHFVPHPCPTVQPSLGLVSPLISPAQPLRNSLSNMASPIVVRGLYKKMLRMAYSIRDPTKQLKATTAVRDGFREGQNISDEATIAQLLLEADKHVSYLKIVGSKRAPKAAAQGGKQTYKRDPETGKWVAGSVGKDNNTTVGGQHWGSVTTSHVKRARALDARQHFGNRGR